MTKRSPKNGKIDGWGSVQVVPCSLREKRREPATAADHITVCTADRTALTCDVNFEASRPIFSASTAMEVPSIGSQRRLTGGTICWLRYLRGEEGGGGEVGS